ncbi:hypothetical protein [uncultured Mucilaginibacter sp.]|uniref:hypothetical protein n=1 Tax=uncultured Mucilaginibacter sp. TaxID=797541 RepID=UPI0025F67EDF|nr:hypothetical protein [uncultured Mucilaginibacter sp.]
MRKLYLILFSLSLFSCHHAVSIKAQRLADALAVLKRNSEFRPLNKDDAYDFMNKYYLPRLDSLETGRKIFIHPLTGVNFKDLYIEDSIKLQKGYSADSTRKFTTETRPPRPPLLKLDDNFKWNNKKLLKAVVINDYIKTSGKDNSYDNVDSIKAWHHKYGYGYMCVSYPQFNAYTKRLVIRQWVENDDWCGTGRESKFWFTRTAMGWKTLSEHWYSKN